jgi:hypothetical protein
LNIGLGQAGNGVPSLLRLDFAVVADQKVLRMSVFVFATSIRHDPFSPQSVRRSTIILLALADPAQAVELRLRPGN